MNWFEVLVVAGIFINALLLYCILLDINQTNKRLVDVDESIKTNSDVTKHNLGFVYKEINETKDEVKRIRLKE